MQRDGGTATEDAEKGRAKAGGIGSKPQELLQEVRTGEKGIPGFQEETRECQIFGVAWPESLCLFCQLSWRTSAAQWPPRRTSTECTESEASRRGQPRPALVLHVAAVCTVSRILQPARIAVVTAGAMALVAGGRGLAGGRWLA